MAILIFQDTPNVFVEFISVDFRKCVFSVFGTENNLIDYLSVGAHNILFIVIQPLSGLGSCSFHFSMHFIHGYSNLNPSDLGFC